MDVSTFATKGNLMKAKSDLALAKMGYDLMDRKRTILISEMMSYISRAEEIQAKIDEIFSTAYRELQNANVFLGISQVERVGYSVPEEDQVRIRFRSVMGVDIPSVSLAEKESEPFYYAFSNTNYFLDQAFINFNRVKDLIIEMAEVESTVYLLAVNVKKTQKRANALQSIMIPKFTELVDNIQNTLEEKEREESSRLHVIKNTKLAKSGTGHAFLPSAGRW
ncbi:MAG: V-type ATP synthase subunit D [Clostridiales bacterium]|jgi:V/A-type H+-transporting ATPase subunit D|nr:V-type ATP synthase subunit D [Clostridiales bacterium]